jgi:hypothetical protein
MNIFIGSSSGASKRTAPHWHRPFMPIARAQSQMQVQNNQDGECEKSVLSFDPGAAV